MLRFCSLGSGSSGNATVIDDADEVLRSVSALARYRDVLRDPVRLVDQIETGPLEPETMAADGHLADRGLERAEHPLLGGNDGGVFQAV